MGRKKIEIRPLTDERNRNVTFLKRKAGLMKKAWELSVLCGAEVSILIFNAAGKPFEFSSRELDGEIDRYLEYEGLIERRRGEEFAAMAEAGEDDDDEDDDEAPAGRKNSKTNVQANAAGGPNGQKPVKSLKGKESFKKRMYSRRDMARSAHKRKRMAGGERDGKQGFIDGILSSSDDEGMGSGGSSDGLAYALNMHQHPAFASLPYPSSLPSGTSGSRGALKSEYGYPSSSSYPPMSGGPSGVSGAHNIPPGISAQFGLGGQVVNGLGSMSTLPPNMGGIQWDANLAQRYAEFQLQQNHQRQQRLLLERQRAQLAELGVNIDGAERRLLDDVFGVRGSGGATTSQGPGQGSSHHQHASQAQIHVGAGGQHHTPASHGGMSIDSTGPPPGSTGAGANASSSSDAEFIWPSFGNAGPSGGGGGGPGSSGNSNGNTVAGAGDADGRGYYTTPESYDHSHPHSQSHGGPHSQSQVQAMQEHWAAMGYAAGNGNGNDESSMPIIPGQGSTHSFTSPLSYDEERRRRDEMYAHTQAQGQVQVQGGMGHHEKRIRVT